jgi:hypothetical protein
VRDHHVRVEAQLAVGLGDRQLRVVAMVVEPCAQVDAGVALEVQLVAGAVERQPARDADFALRLVERHPEPPHHALAVQPGVVQPHLAAVIRLLGLEVLHAQQHAEVVVQGVEGTDGQKLPIAVGGREAGREVGSMGHAGLLRLWIG